MGRENTVVSSSGDTVSVSDYFLSVFQAVQKQKRFTPPPEKHHTGVPEDHGSLENRAHRPMQISITPLITIHRCQSRTLSAYYEGEGEICAALH